MRIVGADEGRALNREFRGKDYATNVLTFDYSREPVVVADLVLCAPVVRARGRDAAASRSRRTTRTCWCTARLHAQGCDHETDADAAAMEARESALMRALGFADPYSG